MRGSSFMGGGVRTAALGTGGGSGPSDFAVAGSLVPAQWGGATSSEITASGGISPYTVTGLPYGLSALVSGGSITISGAPQ